MYLSLLARQSPIESTFIKQLADHLNAEIASGTVTNTEEGIRWLSYTYLYVRMKKNPLAYGITWEELNADPDLLDKRRDLIRTAARVLDASRMSRFNNVSGSLAVTDVGRTASHYYIRHESVEKFNELLSPTLDVVGCLHVLCSAGEFQDLKCRAEEIDELEKLLKTVRYRVRAPVDEYPGKCNVLLQNYLSGNRPKSFTLISDTNYILQNGGRVARALFEISLRKGWPNLAFNYMNISTGIEKQCWWTDSPLAQFGELPFEILRKIEEKRLDTFAILDMTAAEIGAIVRSRSSGAHVLELASMLPHLYMDARVQPITRGVIRLTLRLVADFVWNDRYHGHSEPYLIWVEDGDTERLYHTESYHLAKKDAAEAKENVLVFVLPLFEPTPSHYVVRAISERWVGVDDAIAVNFNDLILPRRGVKHTRLLDLPPLPLKALRNESYERLYNYTHFNPIQTQCFSILYHTDRPVLLGAPTGSGKTAISEIAIYRMLNKRAVARAANRKGRAARAKCVYVAPLKALARERLKDWTRKLGRGLGLKVLELTGDSTATPRQLEAADIIVTTPEKWDGVTRGWRRRRYVQDVSLVIIDEIHLLGTDRGPVLEVIVSRMRYMGVALERQDQAEHRTERHREETTGKTSLGGADWRHARGGGVRLIGLSTALANAGDLGDWLGLPEHTSDDAAPMGFFNFKPELRPVPCEKHIMGFPGKAYCPRMASMNKPVYAAIREHSPTKPTLVFVASRRQTRLTAQALITHTNQDGEPTQFQHMSEEELGAALQECRDEMLANTLQFGIGMHHAGLENSDRELVERLFVEMKIQVLVCTATLAWGVNLPAHLVVVKGTEYFDGQLKKYVDFEITDVLQMIGRAGRPQFDDRAVACIYVEESKKNFYKKFLFEPFPVESSLHKSLHNHVLAEIAGETVSCVADGIEYLSWTYFFRRLMQNPSFYSLDDASPEGARDYTYSLISGVIEALIGEDCVEVIQNEEQDDTLLDAWRPLQATVLGRIASFYYLDYTTAGMMSRFLRDARVDNRRLQLYDLLRLVSNATEFSEMPVRHNEGEENEKLSRSLPLKVAHQDEFEDPHVKTFLLLQAHFCRAPFPIVDFVNDTRAALDNATRVVAAAVDIAAESGALGACLGMMTLTQMLTQGRWQDGIIGGNGVDWGGRENASFGVSALEQLPFVDQHRSSRICAAVHKERFRPAFEQAGHPAEQTLVRLAEMMTRGGASSVEDVELGTESRKTRNGGHLVQMMFTKSGMRNADAREAIVALARLPAVQVRATVFTVFEDSNPVEIGSVSTTHAAGSQTTVFQIQTSDEIELEVELRSLSSRQTNGPGEHGQGSRGRSRRNSGVMGASRLSKQKVGCGFWLCVGLAESNELLTVKKVMMSTDASGNWNRVVSRISFPANCLNVIQGPRQISVASSTPTGLALFVVSDSYLGLDRYLAIPVELKARQSAKQVI